MFSKEDFVAYFSEIENNLGSLLMIYTDLLNELQDPSFKNKILVLAAEDMEAFQWVQQEKEKNFK